MKWHNSEVIFFVLRKISCNQNLKTASKTDRVLPSIKYFALPLLVSKPGTSVKRSGKRLRMTMEHASPANLNLSNNDPYAEEKWQKFHFEAILAEEKVLHNRKMQTYEESIRFYEVMAAKQKAMNAGYIPKETDPFYDEKMLEVSADNDTTVNQELGAFAAMDSSETEVDGRDSLEVTPDIISNNDDHEAVFVKREEEVEI